jgi:hypothetical protein
MRDEETAPANQQAADENSKIVRVGHGGRVEVAPIVAPSGRVPIIICARAQAAERDRSEGAGHPGLQ